MCTAVAGLPFPSSVLSDTVSEPSYSWTTSGDRPRGRECCDASLQTSCGGQRVDTLPLRRLLHQSPSILPGIMAAGHASRYKTGLRGPNLTLGLTGTKLTGTVELSSV